MTMAINNFPFIKTDYLKQYAIPAIDKNVDNNHLVPYIFDAQSRYLIPSLGSYFFDDLKTKGLAGTLSTDEQSLIDDYIKPMVLHYTIMGLLEDGASLVSNKGMLEKNATFANPMTQPDIIRKSNLSRNRAEDYRTRLVKFLLDNYSTFYGLSYSGVQNIY